jgi:Peptidase MA superfamily
MGSNENIENNTSGSTMITNEKLISGSWIGAIKMGNDNPDLVLNLFADSSGALAGNLSVPGKGIKDLPLSGVKIEQDSILLEIAAAQARFKGAFTEDELSNEGTWNEGENSYQLRLVPLTEEIDYENVKHEISSSLNLEATSAHFELYSEKKDREVLENLSEILERNYKVITDHLNTEFENKIRGYIYPDLHTFHKAINYPEAPDWVVGAAGRNELKMVSPLNPGSVHSYESLMQAIVHEFAHTVVLNIREHGVVGLPNWLNEGYASYEADQLTDNQRKLIQSSLLNKTIPSWNELKEANTAQFGDMGGYGFSATIIEFLVQSYGFDKLRKFFLKPESVEGIYDVSEKKMETLWLKYLRNIFFEN